MWSDVQAQMRQASRDRQRVRRQSLTPEQREELNDRRRTSSQRMPEQERHALLARRRANARARNNTPCTESIMIHHNNLCKQNALHSKDAVKMIV